MLGRVPDGVCLSASMRMRDPGVGYRLRPRGASAENLWAARQTGGAAFRGSHYRRGNRRESQVFQSRRGRIDVMENHSKNILAAPPPVECRFLNSNVSSFHEDLKDVDSRPRHRKPRQRARPPSSGLLSRLLIGLPPMLESGHAQFFRRRTELCVT